jgi:hypothetical protein
MPMLVLVIPLRMAVPLMLVFDLASGLLLGLKNRRFIERREALRLIPFMLGGMAVVLALVERTSWGCSSCAMRPGACGAREAAAPGRRLGRALRRRRRHFHRPVRGRRPVLHGYLTRRLPDKLVLRATISGVLFFSAVARLVLFSSAGLYRQASLPLLAAVLLPCALGGFTWATACTSACPPNEAGDHGADRGRRQPGITNL